MLVSTRAEEAFRTPAPPHGAHGAIPLQAFPPIRAHGAAVLTRHLSLIMLIASPSRPGLGPSTACRLPVCLTCQLHRCESRTLTSSPSYAEAQFELFAFVASCRISTFCVQVSGPPCARSRSNNLNMDGEIMETVAHFTHGMRRCVCIEMLHRSRAESATRQIMYDA